ncbi:hypothetical protein M0804_013792 [Polistes exclamans]|nr:hypothetical protein M0804_013792 [Polistes exclamans]
MFIGQCKNIIENEESRGEEVVCFRRKVWNEFANRQRSFTFTGKSGLLMDLPSEISASEVLSLFLDENLISLIVTETNRYAEQKLQQETIKNARFKRWKPTTCVEIKEFIVLMIWMGLVQTPLVTCWSKEPINNFAFPCSQMTRNRFELLLAKLHFANNETIEEGEDIVIDETIVLWRGRLMFRQYFPTKSHKYDTSGSRQVGLAENVCIELADKLINEERTLFVDNFYTSYQLALKCLQFKTHVVGTVRYNTKFMPSFVMPYPLKRGDIVSREDDKEKLASTGATRCCPMPQRYGKVSSSIAN